MALISFLGASWEKTPIFGHMTRYLNIKLQNIVVAPFPIIPLQTLAYQTMEVLMNPISNFRRGMTNFRDIFAEFLHFLFLVIVRCTLPSR